MNIYSASFKGRKAGAIGCMSYYHITVEAKTDEDVFQACYNAGYEHIMGLEVREMK